MSATKPIVLDTLEDVEKRCAHSGLRDPLAARRSRYRKAANFVWSNVKRWTGRKDSKATMIVPNSGRSSEGDQALPQGEDTDGSGRSDPDHDREYSGFEIITNEDALSEYFDFKGTPGRRLTILSIDGGGMRGLLPAIWLENLEENLREFDGPNARISDYFDIVAGSGSGSFTAALLTAPGTDIPRPIRAVKIKDLYLAKGKKFFTESCIHGTQPIYRGEVMMDVLTDIFKNQRIHKSLCDLLIPSYDIKTKQPMFITKHAAIHEKYNFKIVDAVYSSMAIPGYFSPCELQLPEEKAVKSLTLVGGVVAHNPTQAAITQGLRDLRLETSAHHKRMQYHSYEDLLVLSLGTGERNDQSDPRYLSRWDYQSLMSVIFSSNAYVVDFEVANQFENHQALPNYLRIQTNKLRKTTKNLDDASRSNLRRLEGLANEVLNEKATYRDVHCGAFAKRSKLPVLNRDALRCFARCLVEERAARIRNRARQPGSSSNCMSLAQMGRPRTVEACNLPPVMF